MEEEAGLHGEALFDGSAGQGCPGGDRRGHVMPRSGCALRRGAEFGDQVDAALSGHGQRGSGFSAKLSLPKGICSNEIYSSIN